jgi:hypothetical protein
MAAAGGHYAAAGAPECDVITAVTAADAAHKYPEVWAGSIGGLQARGAGRYR